CTSTSWPPGQRAILCGWLLPGPCTLPDVAPFCRATSAAVVPLPYRFEASPAPIVVAFAPVEVHPLLVSVQLVSCDVAFVGLTPFVDAEFWLALPPPAPLDSVEAVSVFLTWPGAFAEFPLSWEAESVAETVGVLAA